MLINILRYITIYLEKGNKSGCQKDLFKATIKDLVETSYLVEEVGDNVYRKRDC